MTIERNKLGRFVKGGTKNPKAYTWMKGEKQNKRAYKKGLTKENDESILRQSKKVSKTFKKLYKTGKRKIIKEFKHDILHTRKTKDKISKKLTTTGITLYRKIAYKKYGYKCNRCGVNDKRILLVHHIDRNRYNNKVENLEVLCYNCHAIEHRFGHRKK